MARNVDAYLGGDLDASLVVRAGGALHQSGDGVKLVADLLHHG